MKTRGSITVFFSLLLSVVLMVTDGFLISAKIAAGRAQIANAADQAVYSQLAQYDSKMFDMYHLFFMDAGYGSNTLQLGKSLEEMESDLSYLFMPNKGSLLHRGVEFLDLQEERGSITGYTLATDCGGKVFREQAVQYMKDTLGIQSVSALYQRLSSQEKLIKQQESLAQQASEQESMEEYERIKNEFMENQNGPDSADVEQPVQSEQDRATALETVKAMDAAVSLKKASILKLVVPNPDSLSGWKEPSEGTLSDRVQNQGMGLIEIGEDAEGPVSEILFQEYILKNLNHFRESRHETGPAYGVEYVLQGKTSDIKNLESIANRLLLLRFGANILHLYSDSLKRAEAQSLALTVSSLLLVPEISPAIESAIIIGWAFAESLVDVRGLFSGDSVPLIKTADAWQVGFSDIPKLAGGIDAFRKSSGNTFYEDYLRLFLFIKSGENKINRCMDVVEMSMRQLPGREYYSLDCLVDTIEVEFEVRSEKRKTFTVSKRESYRML